MAADRCRAGDPGTPDRAPAGDAPLAAPARRRPAPVPARARPARVGKTTALYQTVHHLIAAGIAPARIWWLRVDHPLLLQEDLGDLVRAVLETSHASTDEPVFLLLDELVYTGRWDLWLKTFFDEQWPVRIAATSSATQRGLAPLDNPSELGCPPRARHPPQGRSGKARPFHDRDHARHLQPRLADAPRRGGAAHRQSRARRLTNGQ